MKHRSKTGFTLLELLVVIAIIGVLAGVILASLNLAREKAKIAQAQAEIDQIRKAMLVYLNDTGSLPPGSDICSSCTGTDPCNGTWVNVANALVGGGYMGSEVETDPWGNYYCYDNNYFVDSPNCTSPSTLWSMGPDGSKSSADNIRIYDLGPTC